MRQRIVTTTVLMTLVLFVSSSIFYVSAQNGVIGFVTNTPASGSNPAAVVSTQAAPTFTATPPVIPPTATLAPTATPTIPVPTQEQIYNVEVCQYVPGQLTSPECIALMEKYPEPNVTPIKQDGYTLDNYNFWKIPTGGVPKYDAPGGNVIGEIPTGFNFVHAVDTSIDGWLQIEGGEWIQRDFAEFRQASYFTGVLLPPGWNQPFGWVLDTTGIYASLYPGGPSTSESGLIPLHYERYNIFAEAEDEEGWKWYLVGPNQWVKQVYMAVIQPTPRPEEITGHWVAIDLFEQTLVAYENDTPVFASLVSTGLPGTETNEGIFKVWASLPRDAMSGATGAPNAYALQSVPWVMYFDGSISLHGTYWHDTFGYRRSRGCVNLSISDARWVFEWRATAPAGPDGNPLLHVYVHSTGEYREGDNK